MYLYTPPNSFDPEKHFKDISLYQGLFYRRWQERIGRPIVALAMDDEENKIRAYVQCVGHTVPLLGTVWVAFHGPLGSFGSVSIEEEFYEELCRQCLDAVTDTVHIRIQGEPTSRRIRTKPAERTLSAESRPPTERVITLNEDLDAIIGNFAADTRSIVKQYEQDKENIRFYSEKTDFKSHLSNVYALLSAESASDNCEMHPFAYYESLFDEMNANPEYVTLTLGYISDGKTPVSAVITAYAGYEAHCMLTANAPGYETMPTLALYTAIKDSKKQGLWRYNLGAVSMQDDTVLRTLRAQSAFKGKFGGNVVDRGDLLDIVVSGLRYRIFRAVRWYPVTRAYRFLRKWYLATMVELREEYNR